MSRIGLGGAILGHYGGIDEIGIYVIPALLAFVLLRWADRRAQQRAEEGTADDESETSPQHGSPSKPDSG